MSANIQGVAATRLLDKVEAVTQTGANPRLARYPSKIRLSGNAEATIAGYAVDLLLDRLQLWQLPDALQEFWAFAFESGRTSREPEIDRLNYLADLWYYCYANRKTPADFMSHQTSALWQEAVTS